MHAEDPTRSFARLRPRLQAIAYRMLGSVAEAEEVVQDAWLRWHDAQSQPGWQPPDSAEAWLVTVATRLSIDRLRAAKLQREHYTGIWLPEPLLTDSADSPEVLLERADDVSVAFLLHEVLDVDYPEVARILEKTEAACRQLVSRAKKQLADERPRYEVSADTHHRLLSGFAQALTGGNFGALRAMLDDQAELIGDGGGKLPSFPEPLVGGQRIAQLFYASHLRVGEGQRLQLVRINGDWGLLRFIDGKLESALSLQTDGTRIVRIQAQRNPDKLARIASSLQAA